MKIEKVNDHQIRCTLTGADLANRQLKISELAYGSEKAKNLFRDMMQQANFEFGFEAEDIPLMIEAIPINADCIVLIITKVEDPDELDTRFSNFAPGISDEEDPQDDMFSSLPSNLADDVLDLFHKIKSSAQAAFPQKDETSEQDADSGEEKSEVLPRMLITDNLNDVCRFARCADGFYEEQNALYKNEENGCYYLLMALGRQTTEQFARVLNMASEYGRVEKGGAPKLAFIQEHYTQILGRDALHALAQI